MAGLVDAAGTAHEPSDSSARIVCLVPSITELLCDLGLADNLVGRTGFCVHPKEAVRHIAKVGGTKTVDLAKVRSLVPSHVIVNIDENEKPAADALATFVPHVVVTHPLAPLDNLALYRLIGGLFGRAGEAESLCSAFHTAYDTLTAEKHARMRYSWSSMRQNLTDPTIGDNAAIHRHPTIITHQPTALPRGCHPFPVPLILQHIST